MTPRCVALQVQSKSFVKLDDEARHFCACFLAQSKDFILLNGNSTENASYPGTVPLCSCRSRSAICSCVRSRLDGSSLCRVAGALDKNICVTRALNNCFHICVHCLYRWSLNHSLFEQLLPIPEFDQQNASLNWMRNACMHHRRVEDGSNSCLCTRFSGSSSSTNRCYR